MKPDLTDDDKADPGRAAARGHRRRPLLPVTGHPSLQGDPGEARSAGPAARTIGSDPAAADVITAFEAAQDAGLPPVRCYLAGVDAWCRVHPDQTREYA